jgi:ComF family protein
MGALGTAKTAVTADQSCDSIFVMQALQSSTTFRGLGMLLSAAADLILPHGCAACRRAVARSDALCASCWSEIRFIEPPFCPVYGTPFAHGLGEGTLSVAALADPPPFRRARSAAVYADAARRIVHSFKYRDKPHLAQVMARSMRRAGRDLLADCDLIVPVPLHRWRLWQRRYNQAAALAAVLAELTGIPANPLILQRVKATRRQVGLNPAQRQENVRGAFRVVGDLAGRRVLLVDDVYTSGATVKAATRALLRARAAQVDVLTFARVVDAD